MMADTRMNIAAWPSCSARPDSCVVTASMTEISAVASQATANPASAKNKYTRSPRCLVPMTR
jgi:hypothetical protein